MGKTHGIGILNLPNGFRYEGEFRDGHMAGQGTLYDSSGAVQVQNGSSSSESMAKHGKVDLESEDKNEDKKEKQKSKKKKKKKSKKKKKPEPKPKNLMQRIESALKIFWPF